MRPLVLARSAVSRGYGFMSPGREMMGLAFSLGYVAIGRRRARCPIGGVLTLGVRVGDVLVGLRLFGDSRRVAVLASSL